MAKELETVPANAHEGLLCCLPHIAAVSVTGLSHTFLLTIGVFGTSRPSLLGSYPQLLFAPIWIHLHKASPGNLCQPSGMCCLKHSVEEETSS